MSNKIQVRTIQTIENEIFELKEQTANNILEIGKKLIEAKEQLNHGEWGNWLEEKINFSQRTANQFMRIATEFSNSQSLSNLGTTKLFLLLDVPTDKRENFIKENNLESMTTRQIQQEIRNLKDESLTVNNTEVIDIEIDKLKPLLAHSKYFKNIIGNAWIDFLKSVQTSGIVDPILISQDNIIISGHQRVRACRDLDMKIVPCYIKKYINNANYSKEDMMLRDCLTSNLKLHSDDFDIAWNGLNEHGWI
ncbi:DUF3102 domain-containing protein [Caproiciproducens faecalis]|uniref:DUF3102 domain-containing protein n=1 Tax=Caproiciproducens faecalis TaxID=2820301 RepID=A0ABS7DMX3_9FIRM|nr:DUF3102 domain-containing protein [Caproiciproducens faecalis]MBW7572451.1 DUF3102 domain-containing protein [Caproiciproducens faecalis]